MLQKLNNEIAVIGIDIGKNSFHIVGQDQRGAIVLRQKWSRGQVESRLANLLPCLIGMEACVGAHHLSRKLTAFGHDARLMPAKYVRRTPLKRARRRRCDAHTRINIAAAERALREGRRPSFLRSSGYCRNWALLGSRSVSPPWWSFFRTDDARRFGTHGGCHEGGTPPLAGKIEIRGQASALRSQEGRPQQASGGARACCP